MFGLRKKIVASPSRVQGRTVYKQVAVTPEAHAKLRRMADKANSSMIDTVDHLLGV